MKLFEVIIMMAVLALVAACVYIGICQRKRDLVERDARMHLKVRQTQMACGDILTIERKK